MRRAWGEQTGLPAENPRHPFLALGRFEPPPTARMVESVVVGQYPGATERRPNYPLKGLARNSQTLKEPIATSVGSPQFLDGEIQFYGC